MPAAIDTLLPPRYDDVRPLARGGMGEIYRATDRELAPRRGDQAARGAVRRRSGLASARFRREALAAARLSGTPNIVTIFDVGEHNGRPLIVMEYFPGGSLAERVATRKPCPTGQALDWLEETSAARSTPRTLPGSFIGTSSPRTCSWTTAGHVLRRGLRDRQRGGTRLVHAERERSSGTAGLPLAGAGARRAGDRRERPVRARRRRVGAPDRAAGRSSPRHRRRKPRRT